MARWALISGPKGSDKATQALALARAVAREGGKVGGFYQDSLVDENGLKRHDLVHFGTGRRVVLAAEVESPGPEEDVTFCSLAFRSKAFDEARGWLEEDLVDANVVFVGDVSKVEVSGGGHDRAVRHILEVKRDIVALLSARADQLFWVVERYSLEDDAVAALELPASTGTRAQFRRDVSKVVARTLRK